MEDSNGIYAILWDKELKAKTKVDKMSGMILDGKISLTETIRAAKASKDSDKANCIEAIQFATKAKPELASLECLKFVTEALLEKAPRVKWESAKVIGNIAHLFPDKLNKTIANLLTISEHSGTVVRWSAAFALGEIVKLRTKHNRDLIPAVEAIIRREEDNAIKKIYIGCVKQSGA